MKVLFLPILALFLLLIHTEAAPPSALAASVDSGQDSAQVAQTAVLPGSPASVEPANVQLPIQDLTDDYSTTLAQTHAPGVLHRVWYLSNPTSETLLSSSTSSTRGLSTYCVSPYRATGVLLRVFDGNLADTTSTTSSRTPTWSLEPPHHLLC